MKLLHPSRILTTGLLAALGSHVPVHARPPRALGTYSLANSSMFMVDAGVDRSAFASIFDFDADGGNTVTFSATTDAAHNGVASLKGAFSFQCKWTPSYAGEQPPTTKPYAVFQVDAQLWGPNGTASATSDGTTVINTMGGQGVWQSVGTVYVQVADELVKDDNNGYYFDDVVLDTYQLNCTGSNGNYGSAKLRYTYMGMVSNP